MRKVNHTYIQKLIAKHESYRRSCINLIASENVASEATIRAYMNDFLHRYTISELNFKGNRIFLI